MEIPCCTVNTLQADMRTILRNTCYAGGGDTVDLNSFANCTTYLHHILRVDS